MSEDDDADGAPPHPRETLQWFGHEEAERALLDAYRGGRMPHAWLLGGPPGIGKATLAYRMARFVLAHPDGTVPAVQDAGSLALPPDHRAARLVAAQGHPDLLVLERRPGDSGALRSVIAVEDVRKLVPFLGSTAGEAGWRVVVVDSADELNASGANALLKLLEEPPRRCMFLIVSHAPGRLLATIRSRCRRLLLRPLAPADIGRAVGATLGRDPDEPAVQKAAAAADGSVANAIALLGGPLLAVRERVIELLALLPATDRRAVHALAESLERADRLVLATFVDVVRDWLSARLAGDLRRDGRLVGLAQAWEDVNRTAREVEMFNLERKPLVFKVFGWLAEAARG
ncbi:MAG TPA: DNA polymerase III subunit delta' [Xanthobacteraceae bacterium]